LGKNIIEKILAKASGRKEVSPGQIVEAKIDLAMLHENTGAPAVMAFREINEWKFIKPVFIGDTVHVEITILETKALPRIGGGAIVLSLVVNNQQDETVMKGRWTALVASRPSKPA